MKIATLRDTRRRRDFDLAARALQRKAGVLDIPGEGAPPTLIFAMASVRAGSETRSVYDSTSQ
jgi:hypothetical protein